MTTLEPVGQISADLPESDWKPLPGWPHQVNLDTGETTDRHMLRQQKTQG